MMRRHDLRRLARVRAVDAQALFSARRYPGAYYIAGYSIECAIKACIANQTKRYEFPDKGRGIEAFQHNLEKLIKTVRGLDTAFQQAWQNNAQFRARWGVVNQWTVESRYDLTIGRQTAKDMIEAVTDRPDGVLEWFQQHWHL